MLPKLLKGHERPLTTVKFNHEGDLFFTCAKDKLPCLWRADTGERIGTYGSTGNYGHNGACMDLDVNFECTRLLTGSMDNSAKLWDVQSGKELLNIDHNAPVRAVSISAGNSLFLTCTFPFRTQPATIQIFKMEQDISDQTTNVQATLVAEENEHKRTVMTSCFWSPTNDQVISADDKGIIRKWDVETGAQIACKNVHEDGITCCTYSPDKTMLLSSSIDKTAKLLDFKTLEVLKTYQTTAPVNCVAMSPIYNHVMLAGGQDASEVTTTSSRVGHFEVRFFHTIFEEEMGTVKGHFGPVNACAFFPNGRGFVSGGEDGYVRLHHFDPDYFNWVDE